MPTHPNSGLPEFGTIEWPKSDISDFGGARSDGIEPPATTRRRSRRLFVDASLCLFILVGCPNGDFGRVRPSLTADDIHNWVGRDAARDAGAPISLYPLTDDERLLRDLAYPLIEPPYDRQRWYSVLNEWGVTRVFQPDWWRCDPTAYAARLVTMWVRSETTRYTRLIEDVRNDVARIEQFFPVARRVLDIDVKREKSLSHIPVLSGAEIANALSRVGENLLTVGWVQRSLAERAAAYQFALERLMVAVPSPLAVEAERSIKLLQQRTAENILVSTAELGIPVAAVPVPAAVPIPRKRAVVSK